MKKILRNLTCGLLLCGGLFAGCSDVDNVIEDIPYSRTLTPLNFEADVVASVGTSITFSWSAVSNADAYILEIFAGIDSTNDEGKAIVIEPDYATAMPDYTFDVNPDQIPFTVADMTVDKSFYARVRAVSRTIDGSHWAYLTDYVSTSAVRSNLNPVVGKRTANAVTINWDDAQDKNDLTSVRYEPVVSVEGVDPVTVALTDEEKSACSFTVADLAACTNYKFTLLFGKSGSRGVVTAWTRPDTSGTTRIESSEAFVNAISSAAGDLKLLLAYNDGVPYDLTPIMPKNEGEGIFDPYSFAYGLEIYGESTEDGRKPVVKGALSFKSGATKVHFEDVSLDGGNNIGVFVVVNKDVAMTDAEFINCDMAGFTKGIWNSVAGCSVDNLIYDGVYVHDVNNQVKVGDANGGDLIDIRGGAYKKLEIKNSTFYACARSFLQVSGAGLTIGTIDVRSCTFNQVTLTHTSKNNSGIFHVRHSNKGVTEATISEAFTLAKCVFLNMNAPEETASSYWVRMTRASNENYAPTCDGNIYYNVGNAYEEIVNDNCHTTFFFNLKSLNLNGEVFTEQLALAGDGMMLAEDPCTNSIAGKMYLKNGVIAANRAGDPRWWNASEPVIVRPTELVPVTEPTVWDFTDKTKFQTETVETSTIIENIRIYGPAEIVMNEGVVFASAATVNSRNIPQSNALGFRAEGVGAVEVTAKGNNVTAAVQIVVGEDAYSVLADGETHKVVLGDLSGTNDIYVLPGAACTVTNVTWTDDLTPEKTTTALAAPQITWDPAKVNAGDAVDVVASWEAVENAASYDIQFNGAAVVNTTETSYTVPASMVASLFAGTYEILVVAKPVATSTKYVASEAGKASFKVQAVGLPIKKSWIFADAVFDQLLTDIGDLKKANDKVDTNIAGLTIKSSSAATIQLEERNKARGIRFNKAGSASTTYFSFVVPDNATSGKLTVTGRNPSSSVSAINFVASINGKETKALWAKNDVPVSFDIDVKGGETVYVYPDQGFWFQSIVFDCVDPTASADTVWDFTEIVKKKTTLIETSFSGEYKLNDDGSVVKVAASTEVETLYFHADGAKKIATNERVCTNESKSYFPINYGGGAVYAYINVSGAGQLTVVAAHAKAPADNATCVVSIDVDGTELSETFSLEPQNLAQKLCGAKEHSWDIPATAKKIAIKKKSGSTSPDIYSITWSPAQ